MMRRLAFWLPLVALLALLGYGFWSTRAFDQPLWTPLGMTRLAGFAALYGVWVLVAGLWFPRRFAATTVTAALAYVIAVAGVRAVAAPGLFLLSSWALGGLLGVPGLLGLLLGVSLHAFVIGLAVHLPVNYPAVYAAWLALPLIWGWRRVWEGRLQFARWLRPPERTPRQIWPAALLGLILLMHLLVALKPEVSADGLAVHLAVPASIEAHHRWVFDVRHTAWAVMPLGADWCFTAVYLLGGEAAARLFNFSVLPVILALLNGILEGLLPRGPRWLLLALLASSPIVQLLTGSLFAENFWAALLCGAFAGLVRYRAFGQRRDACVAAVLLGAGLATKFGTLAYALPMAVLAGLELRRRRALVLAPALAGLLVVFGAPPYLHAWLETGNPVFPFLNTVFRSPHFDSQAAFADPRYQAPLSVSSLYDLTFHTSRFLEAQDGGWGFHYLLLVPLAVLFLRRRSSYAEWAALGVSLPFAVLTLAVQPNARYLYPALPLFMVLAAGTLAAARGASAPRYRALLAAALALFFLNLWFLPASGWYHKDFFLNTLLDPSERERYLDASAPSRRLVAYLNEKRPGQPVAFLETGQTAGLRGRAYTVSWHHYDFDRRLKSAASPLECGKLMQELGIRQFVAPSDLRRVSLPSLRSYLAAFTRPEYQRAGWQVSSRRHGSLVSPPAPGPVPSGNYDDTDLAVDYWGQWSTGRQFPKAAHATVTYSNRPGDWFRLAFQGTEITWFYTKAFNRGRAEVFLDGARQAAVDLYSRATVWQARTSYRGLPPGRHALEVRVLGQKHPAATDGAVDVDLLVVR